MMGSATGLRVGMGAAASSRPAGDTPAATGIDFLAALTAASFGDAASPVGTAADVAGASQIAGAAGDTVEEPGENAAEPGIQWLPTQLPALLQTLQTEDVGASEAFADCTASALHSAAGQFVRQVLPQGPSALAAEDLPAASTQEPQPDLIGEMLAGFTADQPQRVPGEAAAGGAQRDLLLQLSRSLGAVLREAAPDAHIPVADPQNAASLAPAIQQSASGAVTVHVGGQEHVLRSAVGTPRWADELGSRLVMMSTRGQHEGSLSLAPEHLGPLEVRISMNQNTAQVWFGAQHADTRAALTEALPRLREMFADAGLALGQAGVSHETPRQRTAAGELASPAVDDTDVARAAPAPGAAMRTLSSALLDLYA
jgi:flagellar hook-length control protein FliK